MRAAIHEIGVRDRAQRSHDVSEAGSKKLAGAA
jgi:hypothetical protein